MNKRSESIVTKLTDRVFPRMPDFYSLTDEQCDHVVNAMEVFVEFMETNDAKLGERVRKLEKEGDPMKRRQMEILNHAFATPMDREDIYRAIVTIDEILNYAKTTVREVEALNVKPDGHMAEMARLLRDGYAKLSTKPMEAETYADMAHKAERDTEKVYRTALAELFNAESHIEALRQQTEGAQVDAMIFIVDIFKRREVYRHLSNASDRLEHAGGVLHDITVKIA